GRVERAVIWAGADPDRGAVAQMADNLVRGPVGAPGGGGPLASTEPLQDRDEPVPLLAEHLQQARWIEIARAPGPQEQPAGQAFPRRRAGVTHRCPLGELGAGRSLPRGAGQSDDQECPEDDSAVAGGLAAVAPAAPARAAGRGRSRGPAGRSARAWP